MAKLKKIMLAIKTIEGGGPGRRMSILCNQLAKSGFRVCLCLTDPCRTQSAYPLEKGVEVFYSDSFFHTCFRRLTKGWRRILDFDWIAKVWRIRLKIIFFRPQTIIIINEQAASALLDACHKLKIPIIFSTEISIEVKISNKPESVALFNDIFSKINGIVYQIDEQREQYQKQFNILDNIKQTVILNPVEPSPLWDKQRVQCHGVIAAVGRDNPIKNYPLLLRAFAKTKEHFQGWTLNIYGYVKPKSSLRTLVKELDLEDLVFFHGFCSDVHERIRDASFYVMSSKYEGLPNALIEAMCLGLPCITTDFGGGGARELITDGENGLIVPSEDEDALAEAMCRLRGDPDYAERLGKNATLLREKLSSDKIIPQWIDFIQSVVDEYR